MEKKEEKVKKVIKAFLLRKKKEKRARKVMRVLLIVMKKRS